MSGARVLEDLFSERRILLLMRIGEGSFPLFIFLIRVRRFTICTGHTAQTNRNQFSVG